MSFRTERSGERNLKNLAKSQDRSYYVYILTNSVRTLYLGVTSDLFRRTHEHRQRLVPGFTRKYNLTWLAYYEETSDVESAIAREKQIKKWRRSKKIALIESANPRWQDMALDWYGECAI